jgi:hypothetical protein
LIQALFFPVLPEFEQDTYFVGRGKKIFRETKVKIVVQIIFWWGELQKTVCFFSHQMSVLQSENKLDYA